MAVSLLAGCNAIPGFTNGIDGTSVASQIQQQATASVAPTEVTFAKQEWEYLVVSNGKVYFGGIASDKQSPTAFFQEATSTQSALDILGKQGWELVMVVGAIGGDQEFILKRPKPTPTSTNSIQP